MSHLNPEITSETRNINVLETPQRHEDSKILEDVVATRTERTKAGESVTTPLASIVEENTGRMVFVSLSTHNGQVWAGAKKITARYDGADIYEKVVQQDWPFFKMRTERARRKAARRITKSLAQR